MPDSPDEFAALEKAAGDARVAVVAAQNTGDINKVRQATRVYDDANATLQHSRLRARRLASQGIEHPPVPVAASLRSPRAR